MDGSGYGFGLAAGLASGLDQAQALVLTPALVRVQGSDGVTALMVLALFLFQVKVWGLVEALVEV